MNTYEVIKRLCADRGTTITNLEAELGFSRGSLGKLEKAHAPFAVESENGVFMRVLTA